MPPLQCNYYVCLDYIQFEWDKNKSETKKKKRDVSFEEAKTVFYDPDALLDDEDRFVLMGISQYLKLLVICHCYRSNEEVIRIISPRRANRDKIKQYGG